MTKALKTSKKFKERELLKFEARKLHRKRDSNEKTASVQMRISQRKLEEFQAQSARIQLQKEVGKEVLDATKMETMFKHQAKVPQNLISKKIKKLKQRGLNDFKVT